MNGGNIAPEPRIDPPQDTDSNSLP